jgi:hypothetical protein
MGCAVLHPSYELTGPSRMGAAQRNPSCCPGYPGRLAKTNFSRQTTRNDKEIARVLLMGCALLHPSYELTEPSRMGAAQRNPSCCPGYPGRLAKTNFSRQTTRDDKEIARVLLMGCALLHPSYELTGTR